MQQSSATESKRSAMLSNEDNQTVFSLLGHNCQSLSTSVIELYETSPPHHRVWSKKGVGVLCFVKDNNRKNYFFRMYCIIKMKMVWEQEVYSKMVYEMPTSFMHTFEGDSCMVAFNFSNEDEAQQMKEIVVGRIESKTRRDTRRLRTQATQKNHVATTNTTNTIENTMQPTLKISQAQKRRRNITKADIGQPSDFKHVSHIGWNKDTGMQCMTKDSALYDLISKAGISENQMQDKATRTFIYDFINKHDTNRIIKDEQVVKERRAPPAIPSQPSSLPVVPPSPSAAPAPPGPPVPPRSGSKPVPNRAAPPPPPSVTHATHEHNNHNNVNNVRNNVPPPRPPTGPRVPTVTKAAVPPPPPANAPAPPPPPPAMTPVSPPPPMPPMMPAAAAEGSQPDGRSALLESIRSGANLRPVDKNSEPQERPRSEDARGDLLSEIRKGFQLKPCNEREVKPISPAADAQHNGVNDLAAALSRALAERNRVIHPDDDDDDESSDSNDEWDD